MSAIISHKTNYISALDVEGVHVVELASGEDTGGPEFTLQFGTAGAGAPLHRHNWDETFFVLKGSAIFTCGENTQRCTPGSFVFVPAGTFHSFEFGEDGCELFDVTGVGSQALAMFKRISESQPASGV